MADAALEPRRREHRDWPIITLVFGVLAITFVFSLAFTRYEAESADTKLRDNARAAYVYACTATNAARAERQTADEGVASLLIFIRPAIDEDEPETLRQVDAAIAALQTPSVPLDCRYPPKGTP